MNFQDLHELLRLELVRRIESGSLTGTQLARQAGFRQAHISNFLNRKRALSLEGLDRVLAAQGLTISHILPVDLHAQADSTATERVEAVPLVSSSTAMDDAIVHPSAIIETVRVADSRLADHRSRPSPKFAQWQRFVAIRTDAQQSAPMEPHVAAGAIVVIDRHYNSLAPYRAHERTLYAVRCGAALALRYVEFDEGRLILRPSSLSFSVQLIAMGSHETPADYIVGRVCMVIAEF